MSSMIPMAMFGQAVYPGDIAQQANPDLPATFRITMAAIDPSATPEDNDGQPPRATLKIIRQALSFDDSDDDDYDSEDDDEDFDVDQMDAILAGEDSDSDDSEDDEDVKGGPSDPSKSKKAQLAAQIKALAEAEGMDVDDDEEEDVKPNGVNGVSKKSKGKQPASDEDEESDEDDEDDDEDFIEEFVICTLDPQKNYQQPLDITIGEGEKVFFKVSGSHTIYLTGNYVEPADEPRGMYDPDDDEDDEYDLEPDEDELDEDEEEDELDGLEDPRITELLDEAEAPKLVEAPTKADKKANNKRPAEEETLDDLIKDAAAGTNGEQKLSKKQLKKLKKNDGTAAAVKAEEAAADVPSSTKSDKKVQFAKELEQGPTPTKDAKPATDKKDNKAQASLGIKTVQGVTLDDKKLGTGPAAKSGDRVGMRYIGKLQKDNKVFDSNKKGKPFSFKLGAGEVIKGWEIGIQGMSVGGERRITIPAHLAYGSKGAGKDIPGNSTLVFDVKLVELGKK